ncbi:hypothetical protein FPQ18DRAFT_315862 [Pyronema domesticum]|uniref:Uncharacterized protein n=1 Tax=Pyronema omphalodes (strain CBS 100304) TaxID=1076935 RepID=U4LFS4_PYROM|nr:hypothetical protein FPQ18DRAFT_315862 [Pyronema domesticum]CCX30743.1 Similar to hypothetical protein [Tuber melanosporum Mel28]; acc. no. XP_002840378 [Pyronema omphalodes CBS 100304]
MSTTTTKQQTSPTMTTQQKSDMLSTVRRVDSTTPPPFPPTDRRLSKEWDAAKTPPSRFQRPAGSIFGTPASRDGQIAKNKIHGFKEKVKELSGKK